MKETVTPAELNAATRRIVRDLEAQGYHVYWSHTAPAADALLAMTPAGELRRVLIHLDPAAGHPGYTLHAPPAATVEDRLAVVLPKEIRYLRGP